MGQESCARLFFALWPDDGSRVQLSRILAALPATVGRKVRPENLHLTLLFLGATPRASMAGFLQGAAALAARAESFDLEIARCGWWRKSGIFWLAPTHSPAPLEALAGDLAALARGLGHPVPRGEFRPHISLLRKVKAPPSPPPFAALTWHARDFVLAESVMRAEGPEYRVIARWPLRTSAPPGPPPGID